MSFPFTDHLVPDSSMHEDPTCILLFPSTRDPLASNVIDRISAALATRYDVRKNIAKLHVPHEIEQWGKVRRIDGGDTMVAALLGRSHLDRRDASHIRVRHQHQCNRFLFLLLA